MNVLLKTGEDRDQAQIMSKGEGDGKMKKQELTRIEVNAAELKMIELARGIEFGQIVVTIKRGVPVHMDELRKSIDLPTVK